jgi:hypothetical protein
LLAALGVGERRGQPDLQRRQRRLRLLRRPQQIDPHRIIDRHVDVGQQGGQRRHVCRRQPLTPIFEHTDVIAAGSDKNARSMPASVEDPVADVATSGSER